VEAKRKTHIMAALPPAAVGESIIDELTIAGRVLRLERPASPEQILDLEVVADAYAADEYMPYWAALWPVSTALSKQILEEPWDRLPVARTGGPLRAIELGCGLGLPGVAALLAGLHVTFTDYDETALIFAARNAGHNGASDRFRTMTLDWRAPLDEAFDVIIASDLIYEARNVEPLVALFEAMLAPGGVVLAADQNRPHAAAFVRELERKGFRFTATAVLAAGVVGDQAPAGTCYRIGR
jgi:predicted nicotinamide N-methyase